MKRPTRVILLSNLAAGNTSASGFTIIDLNLMQVNTSPFLLFLLCRKKTGPFESSLMMMAMMGITHESTPMMMTKEKAISQILLSSRFPGLSSGSSMKGVMMLLAGILPGKARNICRYKLVSVCAGMSLITVSSGTVVYDSDLLPVAIFCSIPGSFSNTIGDTGMKVA